MIIRPVSGISDVAYNDDYDLKKDILRIIENNKTVAAQHGYLKNPQPTFRFTALENSTFASRLGVHADFAVILDELVKWLPQNMKLNAFLRAFQAVPVGAQTSVFRTRFLAAAGRKSFENTNPFAEKYFAEADYEGVQPFHEFLSDLVDDFSRIQPELMPKSEAEHELASRFYLLKAACDGLMDSHNDKGRDIEFYLMPQSFLLRSFTGYSLNGSHFRFFMENVMRVSETPKKLAIQIFNVFLNVAANLPKGKPQ